MVVVERGVGGEGTVVGMVALCAYHTFCEIAALQHEARNDAMELAAFVPAKQDRRLFDEYIQ